MTTGRCSYTSAKKPYRHHQKSTLKRAMSLCASAIRPHRLWWDLITLPLLYQAMPVTRRQRGPNCRGIFILLFLEFEVERLTLFNTGWYLMAAPAVSRHTGSIFALRLRSDGLFIAQISCAVNNQRLSIRRNWPPWALHFARLVSYVPSIWMNTNAKRTGTGTNNRPIRRFRPPDCRPAGRSLARRWSVFGYDSALDPDAPFMKWLLYTMIPLSPSLVVWSFLWRGPKKETRREPLEYFGIILWLFLVICFYCLGALAALCFLL